MLLELEDALLDRVPGDQPVGEDRLLLADPVGAVDRLRFDGARARSSWTSRI